MSRSALLSSILLVLGCSDLTVGSGGVVQLEVTQPQLLTIEIGETLALTARALDKDGNEVAAPVTWLAPDPTLTVDAAGVITGVSAGTGRVQASAGNLPSAVLQFTVIPRADTLIVTDSVFTIIPGGAASPPLVAALQSFNLAGPLADRPIVYAVIDPPEVVPHLVELPGGVLTDTLNTGTDGAVTSVTLNRATLAQPDTAIVEVRAFRTRGAPVPGSGQRFRVIFQ